MRISDWSSDVGSSDPAHPERVSALVLRGIFLGSKREIEWFLYGMDRLYPEHWRNFVAAVPEHERDDLMTAFEKRRHDPDNTVQDRISVMQGQRGYAGGGLGGS